MNTKKIYPISVMAILLASCDFSEDCIRYGNLITYPSFTKIEEAVVPLAETRHLIPYGKTVESPYPEILTFTQDTLRWSAPQGDYDFIFYNGKNPVLNIGNINEVSLFSETVRTDGRLYIKDKQEFVCFQQFSEKLVYQKDVYKEFEPEPFTQTIVLRIHLYGNTYPVIGLQSELDGISLGKYLQSGDLHSLCGTIKSEYVENTENNSTWVSTNYVFGVNPQEKNNLRVTTITSDTSAATYELDLSQYLNNFKDYRITIDIDLTVGKGMEINTPVNIEGWVDGSIVDIS